MEEIKEEKGFMINSAISPPKKAAKRKRHFKMHKDKVKILDDDKVLVPISEIKNLYSMSLLSVGLGSAGGVVLKFAEVYTGSTVVGISLIALGLFIQALFVERVLRSWTKGRRKWLVY